MPILPALPNLAHRPASALIAQAASVAGTGGGCDRHGNTAVTSNTAMQAAWAASFLARCPLAQAQSVGQEPADGLGGRIGRRHAASAALALACAF